MAKLWAPIRQAPEPTRPPSWGTQFLRGLAGVVPSVLDSGLKAAIQGAIQNQVAAAADARALERAGVMHEYEQEDALDSMRQQQMHQKELTLRQQDAANKRLQQQQDFMGQQEGERNRLRFFGDRARQAYPYIPEEATRFHGEQEQYLAPETRQMQTQLEQDIPKIEGTGRTIPFLAQLASKMAGAGMAGLRGGRQGAVSGYGGGPELSEEEQGTADQFRQEMGPGFGDVSQLPGGGEQWPSEDVLRERRFLTAGAPEMPGPEQMGEGYMGKFMEGPVEGAAKKRTLLEQLGEPSIARAGRELSKAEAVVPTEQRQSIGGHLDEAARRRLKMFDWGNRFGLEREKGKIRGGLTRQQQEAQAERERAKESMRKPLVRVGAEKPYEPQVPAYQGPGVQKVYPPIPAGVDRGEWQRAIDRGMQQGMTAEEAAAYIRQKMGW